MGNLDDEIKLIPQIQPWTGKRSSYTLTQRYFALFLAGGFALAFTGIAVVCLFRLHFDPFALSSWSGLNTALDDNSLDVPKLAPECQVKEDFYRFDCWPEFYNLDQQKCEARGCCWSPASKGIPYCYYPSTYGAYNVTDIEETSKGLTADLMAITSKPYQNIKHLRLNVVYESNQRVHFKIYDATRSRYEIPIPLSTPTTRKIIIDMDYKVKVQRSPFSITITRKKSKDILFDSQGMAPLIFSDQYLQIGTKLSSGYIFGLGEHQSSFLLNTQWTKFAFWNRDQPPQENLNLYGTHPFYLNLEKNGDAHGVLLFNSNAMEADLQPASAGRASLTYRTTGGVLDFYVFTGPSPDAVVKQYVSYIGTPTMPPFWALGFHMCKYGYNNITNMKAVIERNRAAQMPYDVQWNDIDYMQAHLDWTVDAKNYSGLPALVQDLHKHGQHYIIIVDAGISNTQPKGKYPPYDKGVAMDIFIKNADKKYLVGKVWPGLTVFPDFFHPNATAYWKDLIASFHKILPFDGLWIDMNEPSNFVDGSVKGCTSNLLDNPPFLPPDLDGRSLMSKTLCPSAKQYLSSHYNLHNLYGWSEHMVTVQALRDVLNKRSLVISRSTFPTSGMLGGHWTGDNNARWEDLMFSIPAMLNFQLFGIPMVGADICGFNGPTTPELCTRWMQLGAFYPFMRNHNADPMDQDPASFDKKTQNRMRGILRIRYSLLPFLYTLFFRSHVNGTPVVRPLFFQYPGVFKEGQFLWGSALMITPVLVQNATTVNAFIPRDVWYNFYTGNLVTEVNKEITLAASLDIINIHLRGGSILPMLPSAVTTTLMRTQKFQLLVAPDNSSSASGELYWDDGEILDPVEKGQYTLVSFTLKNNTLTNKVVKAGYKPSTVFQIGTLTVFGVHHKPTTVTINGKSTPFTYDVKSNVLALTGLMVDLLKVFSITWK